MSLRPAWSTEQVTGKPKLQAKPCLKRKKKEKKKRNRKNLRRKLWKIVTEPICHGKKVKALRRESVL